MLKKGQFQMPNFHPFLKDLIQRMLTVNPEKRITIEEIKNHVAFRVSLPSTYILPSPISYPDFANPINPNSISEDIKVILNKIGLSDDEIILSLVADENNPVKIFVSMLQRKTSFHDLPWEKAISSIPNIDVTDLDFSDAEKNIFQNKIKSNRRIYDVTPDFISPESFSFAQQVQWVTNDTTFINYEINETFPPTFLPLPEVASKIQIVLNQLGYIFFYPNDLHFIIKNESDTYIVLDLTYSSPKSIVIHFQMINCDSQDTHDLIYQKIEEVLVITP